MLKQHLLTFLKGIAMGAADVVPGVSGGTIAFITGIYETLLNSIASIKFSLIKTLKTQGFSGVWQTINGKFLLPLLLGVGTSVISLAHLVTWALKHHPIIVWAFFFGLIVASVILIIKQVTRWNTISILGLIIGSVLAFWITTLNPGEGSQTPLYVFLSGAIAICAMILPGISGAFILLLMGSYNYVLGAIKSFDIVTIALFGSGCVIGLLSFSKLLSWAFKHYHNLVIALLSGFLIGSLNKIWPWKETVSTRVNSHGEIVPFIEKNILPNNFEGDAQLILAIICAAIGIAIVLGLEKLGKKWAK